MRIIHIVGSSRFGGEAFVIAHLARLARSLNWEVEVMATDPPAQEFYRENSINVIPLAGIQREINAVTDTLAIARVYRFLDSQKYDIVQTHTSKGGAVGRIAACLAHVPVIIHTVHGFAFHEQSSPFELAMYSLFERIAAQFCNRIVTVSEYHRHWALNLGIGNPNKIVAIPNGISLANMTPSATRAEIRQAWNIGSNEFLIVSTGRLARQKGLEFLLLAAPYLEPYLGQPFRIFLAGSGELEAELKRLANSLGFRDRVEFLGFRRDIGNIILAADLVVLPSLWEGLSISLLEAMAMKKPIVTTSIGSNLEVVKDGESALIVPPKNPGALADAIVRLARDSTLRSRLAEEALARYKQQYTVHKMLEGYRQLYLELLRTITY
jgi:glycosyltransferase involved in cell wall biosynthesis